VPGGPSGTGDCQARVARVVRGIPLNGLKYVLLPTADDPVPPKICHNSKFWLYFKDVVGAIDGSHIHSSPPASQRSSYQNHKGGVSQNCLFACSFDLQFIFAYTGWEGSVTDAWVYESALMDRLDIPLDKCHLVDAGFPSTNELLIPYRSVQYHLAEWGRANVRYVFHGVSFELISKLITGLKIKKNCLTFVTHQLTTSSSTFLVS